MLLTLRLFIVFAIAGTQAGVTVEQHIEKLTGPNAVDCGTFSTIHNGMALPPRTSSTAHNKVDSMRESLACAEQALKERRAFRLLQRGPSIDSVISSGVVGTPDGATLWFVSDSAPCGGPGCASTFDTKPCRIADVAIEPEGRTHVFKCSAQTAGKQP